MEKFDVVIVGSGLGGLITGTMLSKEGFKVCILEKHFQIGGCLQTFKRDGCIFDTGMHYIGSYEEGQILHRYFKYLGLAGKVKVKKLDEAAFDIIHFQSKDYKYAIGYNNFINTLVAEFPEEEKGIRMYTDKLQEISQSLNLYNLKEIDNFNFVESGYITDNTFDFINSCTENAQLRNILAGLNSLYAGNPDKTPMYLHALINNFFIESAWRLVDGSDQVAHLLAEEIEKNGGIVRKNSEVVKFGFEDDDLTHVELKSGEKVYATNFISDIHPERTLAMCDTKKIRKAYRSRIAGLENTLSVFSLYCVLEEEAFPYMNYNYYYCVPEATSIWMASSYDPNGPIQGYMLFTPATSKSEKWADCMTIICYMGMDEVRQWENTTVEKRGDEYLAFKERKAQELLDLAERNFPDLRSKIKKYYTSTPLTYRDYTGTPEGSLYGIMKDCNNPVESYIPPKTKLPNLFLTGQNTNLHGILGVTIGSLMTASELTGLNYLIRKINQAY